MVEQKKRSILFLATCDLEFVKKTYGGYFNVFVSTFGDESEQWDLFRMIDNKFPNEKDLEKYDGFGDADWIAKLCAFCQKLDEMKNNFLGICSGHQVVY